MHGVALRLRLRKPALAILLLAFAAVAADQTPPRPKLGKFKLGADISAIDAPGRGGGAAGGGSAAGGAARSGGGRGALNYNENGTPAEEWQILMRHGWNLFRLRVFVSPVPT